MMEKAGTDTKMVKNRWRLNDTSLVRIYVRGMLKEFLDTSCLHDGTLRRNRKVTCGYDCESFVFNDNEV
jgi:hypothetical protein